MQPMSNEARITVHTQRWNSLLLYPLIGLSALAGTATMAEAASGPAAQTNYRVIQLSANAGRAVINASGQVAFTEATDGVTTRAKLYSGHAVHDLGTLGGPSASVAAINNAGQVTGGASVDAQGTIVHAYRWSQAAGMVDLSLPGQGNSLGVNINNKGQVVGTANFNPANFNVRHAFFWSPQTRMLDIGAFGLPPSDSYSDATALNDSGTAVGYSPGPDGGVSDLLAFRWTRAEGIRGIGTLPSEFTYANDINAAGHIVGGSPFSSSGVAHAFLWTPREGLKDLRTGGAQRSAATKMNEKDDVVGYSITTNFLVHGFIWTRDTGFVEVGAGAPETTFANDVNNRGQVVGGFGDHAYVWSRAQGFVDLNTRIPDAPDGLKLVNGGAVSDNGSIVATANTGLVLLVPKCACSDEAPVVAPIKLSGRARINAPLSFSAAFKDVDVRDSHKATWSWGDGSKNAGTVSERNGTGSVSSQHAYRSPGIYTATLTVTDSRGESTTVQRKVVVGGAGAYVAGNGWFVSPPGASRNDPNHSGIANFAFMAVDGAGAAMAQGTTSIEFRAAGINLRDAQIEALSMRVGQVQFSGRGSVNGAGGYNFKVVAVSDNTPGGNRDRIVIRIWHHEPGSNAEVVDYDNSFAGGASATAGEGTIVEDGAIEVQPAG